jgi:hypothetical protein
MFPPRTFSRLGLPLVLGVAAALVAVPAPAQADVTGTLSTTDVVLYNECQDHAIDYDLAVDPGASFWRLEVQVFGPEGHTSEGTVVNSVTSPTAAGTVNVQFCGSETPGTYTARGTGFWQLVPAVQIPFTLPDTTFEVRPVATRTSLSRDGLGHGRSRFTVRVLEQSPDGWSRADGVLVRLERLVDGQWRKVRGTNLTTVRGRVTTALRTGHARKVRAVTPARQNYGGSLSVAVPLGG